MSKSNLVLDEKKLPICVECTHEVKELYSPSTSPANIKLTICDNCSAFADKYVEYDSVLISLDLILHRIAVYRHLLFNVNRSTNEFSVAYKRLLIAVMIFTSYAKIDLWHLLHPKSSFFANVSVSASSALEILCYIASLSILCILYTRTCSKKVVTDVIHLVSISLFPHLFYLLAIIWRYPPHFLSLIHLFSLSSTCIALSAYLKSPSIAITFLLITTGLNYALFHFLGDLNIPSVHLIASTGVLPKLWQITLQLLNPSM